MINEIDAYIYGNKIGTLIEDDGIIYFSYSTKFRSLGIEVSPLKLPLAEKGLYTNPDHVSYCGLPGVFHDSLPDSYGMNFIDRYFQSKGLDLRDVTLLHKLMFIGDRGMGAIEYLPCEHEESEVSQVILNTKEIYEDMKDIIRGNKSKSIAELMALIDSASPVGGARPKMLVFYNKTNKQLMYHSGNPFDGFSRYILKFDETIGDTNQSKDMTKFEYLYMQMAKECGINISDIDILEDENGFHLLVRRFDRDKSDERIHILTASALTHKHISVSNSMSYEELFSATFAITNSYEDVEELYRRMVFNVLSRNHDDHAKNFSFIMNKEGQWSLSPAYDITYSRGLTAKHHMMSIRGKSDSFSYEDLIIIANDYSIKKSKAQDIILKTIEVLRTFRSRAEQLGISSANINGCEMFMKEQIALIEEDLSENNVSVFADSLIHLALAMGSVSII